MTQVIRICKYGCGVQLGAFDTSINKYIELDGPVHDKARCELIKKQKEQGLNGHNGNDLSVEVLLKKLETLGIKIDLARLRNI